MKRGEKALKRFLIWHFYCLFWDWLAGMAKKRLINMTGWLRYQHVLVLYAFSTGAVLKGQTPRKMMCNVSVLTVCFGLYLCRDWLCGLVDLRRVYIHEKSMCLLRTKFDHPEGTVYIKIHLLQYYWVWNDFVHLTWERECAFVYGRVWSSWIRMEVHSWIKMEVHSWIRMPVYMLQMYVIASLIGCIKGAVPVGV